MNHPNTYPAVLLATALALSLLQVVCRDGVQRQATTRVAPSTQAVAADTRHSSLYPAPQGEAEELPAQF